jgi:hypothetical protein
MSSELQKTYTHVGKLTNTERGYLPECLCGWKGYETDRMSNDYASTNAEDQLREHLRKTTEVTP